MNDNNSKENEWNPGSLLETSGYYWKTCALHAGVKLDIFSIIGKSWLTAKEIADGLESGERGVAMLLNALTAMGLLIKKEGKFSNTISAITFLSRESPQYTGYIIMHHHHLVESWSRLDQAVASGNPVRKEAVTGDETRRESFLMGMFNIAINIAPGVAERIDLSGKRRLIDLGGGPGTYAIHFCLRNPELKATVHDLPTTRPFAEKTIKKFNVADRIKFMDCDYLTEEIQGRFDVAWISHILHAEGPDTCRNIITKTVGALDPGGMIIIHDFLLENSMDGPLFPALFSLNMLLGTESGQSYSEKQIMDMLKDSGVKDIRRIRFKGPNDSGIISGVV